jgi:hypothetical protein
MANETPVAKARCVHCREDIQVADRYAHGDHIKCGACGTDHKVVRGDRLRLVLADVGVLRDALAHNEQLVVRLEAALARTERSFGIGANGIALATAVVAFKVFVRDVPIDMDLLWLFLTIAVVSGLLLEAANWSFLGKRRALTRIAGEIAEARVEGEKIRARIREATRV